MWELIAISNETDRVWRWRAQGREQIRLGRCPKSGWAAPWDMRISSEHADLFFEDDRVRVVRLASARNAIHYREVASDEFTLRPGEEFRIGLTTFRLYAISKAPEVRDRPSTAVEAARRLGQWVDDSGTTSHGRAALQSNLEAALSLLDYVAPGEPGEGLDRDHVETTNQRGDQKSTTRTPNSFVRTALSTDAQSASPANGRIERGREEGLREIQQNQEEILALRAQLSSAAEALQAELKARREAELEAERIAAESSRYRADALAVNAELDALRSQLEKSALDQSLADATLARLIKEERQRANEAEQRHEAEAARRREMEAESLRQRQEAESLVQQVAELTRHIDEQSELRRQIEQRAGHMEQRAEQVEERRAAESQALHEGLRLLLEQAEAKSAVAAAAKCELERFVADEQQRKAQERNERLEAQRAREEAQTEARKRHEELESLQRQMAEMQMDWQSDSDAQRRAEEDAERWRNEAESLKENVKALEARVAESQGARPTTRAPLPSTRSGPLRSRMKKDGDFDPYYRWLAIPPDEQPPDFYRLLGLARFEEDVDIIEYAADRQMDFIRRQQSGKRAHLSQQLLNELSRARLCLRDPERKKQYDAQLWSEIEAAQPPLVASSPSPEVVSKSLDGSAFREYTLLDYIAETRHGHVFKAAHRTLARLVAITILSDAATHDLQLGLRFRLKAQALSRAQHAGLLRAYDAGHLENLSYLVTEFINGTHLVDLLKQQAALTIEQAVGYVAQTADALHYLHERQIIHRNVKPSNILLSRNGSVRLVGLGSALYRHDSSLVDATLVAALQEPWPSGSLDYMPPEQAENSCAIDRTADIYSLGCTLFTLLTRRLIFPTAESDAKKRAHREKPAPSLCRIRTDAPPELNTIYQKMVSKSPRDRYSSLTEVVADFRNCGFQV